MAIEFDLNGARVSTDAPPDTPLLWVLRDDLGMTGTKYGCGIARCGACRVLVNGVLMPACTLNVQLVDGAEVTTIEGLSEDRSHSVQRAWAEIDVPQCGYCQSGQIMSTVALLAETPEPTDAEIDAVLERNLCRCGTYPRIRIAVKRAAELARDA